MAAGAGHALGFGLLTAALAQPEGHRVPLSAPATGAKAPPGQPGGAPAVVGCARTGDAAAVAPQPPPTTGAVPAVNPKCRLKLWAESTDGNLSPGKLLLLYDFANVGDTSYSSPLIVLLPRQK